MSVPALVWSIVGLGTLVLMLIFAVAAIRQGVVLGRAVGRFVDEAAAARPSGPPAERR